VSVSADHYFNNTKYQLTDIVFAGSEINLPGIFPNNQISAMATIPIFDGLANVYRTQAASLIESASEHELDHLKFVLSEQIRLAFYQSLAANALRDAAVENVKTLEDHLKQVDIQRSGGTATKYDTLRVQVQLNEAKSSADDAEDNMLQAHRKLVQLMGLTTDTRELRGDLPVPIAAKVQNLVLNDPVPSDRTDLQALELRSQSADKERSAQNSWFIPTVSAVGQYTYYNLLLYNGGIVDNHNYQSAYSIGIMLNWNLFDGGVSYSRSREASAQHVQAEETSAAARIQVPYDFEYWKKRFLSNTDHYNSKTSDVGRSLESVHLAKIEEKAGTRTSTEVLDAELDLFRSRAGVVNAQVNAAESLVNLELALGRKIDL
jgi:outer membrane protein TolC